MSEGRNSWRGAREKMPQARTTGRLAEMKRRLTRNPRRLSLRGFSSLEALRQASDAGARQLEEVHVGHVLKDAHDLAAVTKLVVVPDVEHRVLAIGDSRLGINDTGVAVADEVGGDHFGGVDVVDLLLERGIQGHAAQSR